LFFGTSYKYQSKGGDEIMKRYVLYYLFLEDKQKNPMSEEKQQMIRKKIQKICQKHKTNSFVDPSYVMKEKINN